MSVDDLIKSLNFNDKGLIPAIIQDDATGKVLTLCYMNEAALRKTFEEGRIYLFRRSKNILMMKGSTSGHVQIVKKIYIDCAENSLLFRIEQKGGACHAGYFTCYFRETDRAGKIKVVEKKVFEPSKVYTQGR